MPAYKNAIVAVTSTDGIACNPARRQIFKMALMLPALHWLGASSFAAERAVSLSAVPGRAYSTGGIPLFFTDAEREFIEEATARLIPDGEDGLGARSAAVGYFIDRQLAGPYGHAVTWYMQGPWKDGTKQQGYQLEQTPAELYRAAIQQNRRALPSTVQRQSLCGAIERRSGLRTTRTRERRNKVRRRGWQAVFRAFAAKHDRGLSG